MPWPVHLLRSWRPAEDVFQFPATAFLLYLLNPTVGMTDGFRWAILGENSPAHLPALVLSFLLSAGSLAVRMRYFRRLERRLAAAV